MTTKFRPEIYRGGKKYTRVQQYIFSKAEANQIKNAERAKGRIALVAGPRKYALTKKHWAVFSRPDDRPKKYPPLKLPAGKMKKPKPIDIRGDIYKIFAVCTGGMVAHREREYLQAKGFKVLVRKFKATKKRPARWQVYKGPKRKRG